MYREVQSLDRIINQLITYSQLQYILPISDLADGEQQRQRSVLETQRLFGMHEASSASRSWSFYEFYDL